MPRRQRIISRPSDACRRSRSQKALQPFAMGPVRLAGRSIFGRPTFRPTGCLASPPGNTGRATIIRDRPGSVETRTTSARCLKPTSRAATASRRLMGFPTPTPVSSDRITVDAWLFTQHRTRLSRRDWNSSMADRTLKPTRRTLDLPTPISPRSPIVAMRQASATLFPVSTINIALPAAWHFLTERGSQLRCTGTTLPAAGPSSRISTSTAMAASIQLARFSLIQRTMPGRLASCAGRIASRARFAYGTTTASIAAKALRFRLSAPSRWAARGTTLPYLSATTRMRKTGCKTRNSTHRSGVISSSNGRPILVSKPTGKRKQRRSRSISRTGSRSVP